MPRRVRAVILVGLIAVVPLVAGLPAGAEPSAVGAKQAEVGEAQARLAQIQSQVDAAYAEYDEAVARLEELNGEIAATNEELIEAEKDLVAARAELEERAAQVYKSGNVGFLDVLMGSEDFSEFARRLELWVRLLAEQRAEFVRVREIRDELVQRQEDLEARRDDRAATVQRAADRRAEAARLVAEAQAYLNNASGELRAA
ncbi:MAG: hypothetical protein AB1425_01425, partial [Actinomycetota bacterium]